MWALILDIVLFEKQIKVVIFKIKVDYLEMYSLISRHLGIFLVIFLLTIEIVI